MTPEELLDRLDPEQREAAAAPPGPVCILAGAGTGKTRTITHRIAHGVLTGTMPAGHVLAVTFTNRAAGEMRSRLRALGAPTVQARTFHAAALRQLGYFAPRVLGGPPPRIAESKARLVAEAAGRQRLSPSRTELSDLLGELEWAGARMIGPSDYPQAVAAAARTPPRSPESIARLMTDYTAVKERHGVMDFDDLLLLTCAVLEEHGDVAAEMRARYRHFVVDEYQDVTPLQQRLLTAWVGDRDSVTVVGDPAQTIYSFAGADPRLLLEFPRRHPGCTVLRLVRDYRSTPQIVEAANRVAAGGLAEPVALRSMCPDGPPVTGLEEANETAEAQAVASRISALVAAGTPASQIAVLFRINAASQAYETALAAAGLPYVLRGGERFFERPEIRQAIVLLRGAARGDDIDADLASVVGEILRAAGYEAGNPPAGSAARERWENLAALARLAAQPDAPATLTQFVALLAERAESAHAPTVEGVTLASLHSAKGLEWDAVFLVGLTEGMVPIVHAVTSEQVAEERRLFYVGVTRARRVLSLSWALARGDGGRSRRSKSRFVTDVLPEPARPPGGGRSVGRTGRAGAAGPPAGVDPDLFERLRAWRSVTAKELRQPAFCVFTDATLTEIARRRPRERAALAAVPGVGAVKLERWGAQVLDICAAPAGVS
jgi:DNA helicase-2/ATP-dependent DNA helicase PcrA